MSEEYVCPYIEIDEGHISCKRISDLEAKLEKAVGALREIDNGRHGLLDTVTMACIAWKTLREIEEAR